MIISGKNLRARGVVIDPYHERTVHNGMSFGESFAGYDVRVEFDKLGDVESYTMKPQEFLLASTIERFEIPPDLVAMVKDKSSWARRGITVQNTVIEPGWCGYLTLELTNHSAEDVIIRRGDPIAQIVFMLMDEPVVGYDGKYQNQARGPVEMIAQKQP